jgi:mRNA-degrading endonuclease HigB of HigAB toxin-antitoxin module
MKKILNTKGYHLCRGIMNESAHFAIKTFYQNSFIKGKNEENKDCYWTCNKSYVKKSSKTCETCKRNGTTLTQQGKYREKSETYVPHNLFSDEIKKMITDYPKIKEKLNLCLQTVGEAEFKKASTTKTSCDVLIENKEENEFVVNVITNSLKKLEIGDYSRLLMINQVQNFIKKPQGFRFKLILIF